MRRAVDNITQPERRAPASARLPMEVSMRECRKANNPKDKVRELQRKAIPCGQGEPKPVCTRWWVQRPGDLHAGGRRLLESRVRENLMHGLTRGCWKRD